jgi:hypothetical protein
MFRPAVRLSRRSVDAAVRSPIGLAVTLHESRLKEAAVFVAGMCFAAMGIAILAKGDTLQGLVVVLFFGAGALPFGVIALRGGRKLSLDQEGLSYYVWPHRLTIPWPQIVRFYVLARPSGSMVGIELHGQSTHGRPASRWARAARMLPGALPAKYGGMSAQEMVDYLDQWRLWAAEAHGAHPVSTA